jgi:hypothetical protein
MEEHNVKPVSQGHMAVASPHAPSHSEHHGETTLHEARSEREPEPGALARTGQLRRWNTTTRPPHACPRLHSTRHAVSVSLALICVGHRLLHLTTAPPRCHRVTAQLLPCRPLLQELPHRPLPPTGSPSPDTCSNSRVDLQNDHEVVDPPPMPLETSTCRPHTRPAATHCEEDKSHATAISASFTSCADSGMAGRGRLGWQRLGFALRSCHPGESDASSFTARYSGPDERTFSLTSIHTRADAQYAPHTLTFFTIG